MSTDLLLLDADVEAVEQVAATVGKAFVAGVFTAAPDLIADRTIARETMTAGIMRAHLLGAVSAIATFVPRGEQAGMAKAAGDFIHRELLRGTR